MPQQTFDFAFVQYTWTWSHRVDGSVVASSSGGFATLNDCIADARKAGFRAGEAVRITQPANGVTTAGSAAARRP